MAFPQLHDRTMQFCISPFAHLHICTLSLALSCASIQLFPMKKLFSTKVSENAFSFSAFILRVGVGSLMMVQHGLDKLMHFAQKAPKFSDPFHIGSTTSLSMVVFAEFFCAAFVILGLFTRLACIPLVIAMSVALFSANKGDFFGSGGSAGLFLIVFLAILVMGPGKVSIDKMIYK
jgi:putative oxidoreductase